MAWPNLRQAIIWTNADPIHWCIYAALGGDELTRLDWFNSVVLLASLKFLKDSLLGEIANQRLVTSVKFCVKWKILHFILL